MLMYSTEKDLDVLKSLEKVISSSLFAVTKSIRLLNPGTEAFDRMISFIWLRKQKKDRKPIGCSSLSLLRQRNNLEATRRASFAVLYTGLFSC